MPTWSRLIDSTELVWHRANQEDDLVEFLASGVRWAECDARLDPRGVVRVSHEPLEGATEGLELAQWLRAVRGAGRSPKIDLKEGGPVIDAALDTVAGLGFHADDLWFNAAIEVPGGAGLRRLAEAHPGARLSCPLDTLAPYLLVAESSYAVIDQLRAWGVNWLCLGSRVPGLSHLVPVIQERRWRVNIWDVENPNDFETALSLTPEAITADLGSIPHLVAVATPDDRHEAVGVEGS